MPYKDIEKRREHDREYCKTHREEKRKYNAEYRRKHRDSLLEHNKDYCKNHKEELKAYHKTYFQMNKKRTRKRDQEAQKKWRKEHPEKRDAQIKRYRLRHPEKCKAIRRRINAKRRGLESMELNRSFDGSHGHHIDKYVIVYVPKELHESIRHNVWTGHNMDKINAAVFKWLESQKTYPTTDNHEGTMQCSDCGYSGRTTKFMKDGTFECPKCGSDAVSVEGVASRQPTVIESESRRQTERQRISDRQRRE